MNLLFVCTGNTCRSVMAEGIFSVLARNKKANIRVSSAGISAISGSLATENAAMILKSRLGIDVYEREAVQLTREHMVENTLILTMTDYIAGVLKNNFPQHIEKIYSFKEYIGEKGDVVDPYGGNIFIYEKTFDILTEKMDLIIKKLYEKEDNL
ncbi:low molecular weight protein arginine phosphatase [Clostridium sediminicola]|uniref:low molecular weight protein arginine phosphatase n=1 Tax=Clostridium sediminicola TaxID=3114879 RepID=UPI0031F25ED8